MSPRLKSTEYQSLLDIGCATGYLLDMLQSGKDALYCGIDLSPEMLKMAKQRLPESVCLTEGSADSLPYDDNSFDAVTCIQSFHHYPKPENSLAEAYRVLKPGDYIFSDTGMENYPRFIYGIYNKIIVKKLNTGDYAAYSKRDIQKHLNF